MKIYVNKNAFQWDAYRLPVDRIPACTGQGSVYPSMHWAVGEGVYPSMHWAVGRVCIPACTGQWGCVCPGVCLAKDVSVQEVSAWGCLPRGVSAKVDVCLAVSERGCLPRGCLPGGCLSRGCLPEGCGGRHPLGPEADTPCCG